MTQVLKLVLKHVTFMHIIEWVAAMDRVPFVTYGGASTYLNYKASKQWLITID